MVNCKQCGKETTNIKFCSRTCNAKYTNSSRIRSEESREKTRKTLHKDYDIDEVQRVISENPKITTSSLAKALGISRHLTKRILDENSIILSKRKILEVGMICDKHNIPYENRYNNGRLVCYKCCSEAVAERRRELKIKAIAYMGGECKHCGYNKSPSALDFHHLDPSEKDFGISVSGKTLSFEKIKTELDKCIMLCANCHREEHERLHNEKEL